MGDPWFTDVADELARCLVDTQRCAETCGRFLESSPDGRTVVGLVPAAAVSRALVELVDQPPQLLLAAVRLCRDSAREAAASLAGAEDAADVVASLRAAADSCERLLAATG